MAPSSLDLQRHARDLAKAFDVRLIESDLLNTDEAVGLSRIRVALVRTIVDRMTYAIALHEIGHLASPTGIVRGMVTGDLGNLLRIEEDAAWTWAKRYALLWTPDMDALATWAEGTYQQAGRSPEPVAPVAPIKINWDDWK
jgi:hypothetical protein